MRIYQVHENLFRIVRGDYVKDVFVKDGKIQEPENVHNQLSDSEKLAIEKELK